MRNDTSQAVFCSLALTVLWVLGQGKRLMASKKERDRLYLERELNHHKGKKWLTEEVVAEIQRKARGLEGTDEQITGERKKLCQELMKEYGVLELEAVNIISGNGTKDYVNKYHRIRNQIPLDIKRDRVFFDEEEDDSECYD